jgi:hypothetical protein
VLYCRLVVLVHQHLSVEWDTMSWICWILLRQLQSRTKRDNSMLWHWIRFGCGLRLWNYFRRNKRTDRPLHRQVLARSDRRLNLPIQLCPRSPRLVDASPRNPKDLGDCWEQSFSNEALWLGLGKCIHPPGQIDPANRRSQAIESKIIWHFALNAYLSNEDYYHSNHCIK